MQKVYSDWMKIDLHIHSDFSRKTKNDDYKGTFTIEKLYSKLIKENVEIFSITDHNILNLEAYKEYFEKHNSDDDPLLLTGVELDIEGTNKTFHSLLIFNCCDYEGTKKINDKLEKKYSVNACDIFKRKLNFNDIITLFDDQDFFFIPHAGNTSSIIDGYKDDIAVAQKMLILLQSPLEKVNEKKRQIYNEGFDLKLDKAFQNKNDFAYIEFSDNHFVEGYPCNHMGDRGIHKFYYVKGSKNYETLRLSFIDPKSRIKSSAEYNDLCKPRDYISTLEIGKNKLLNETKLLFSPHLNVIIGGRSSGKSLLMDIMNRSIDTLNSKAKYETAIKDSMLKISSKYDAETKEKTHINSDILQINQGDIVNYFEDNQLCDLAKKAGKIEKYNEAKKIFEEIKTSLSNDISELQNTYLNLHSLNIDKKFILHNITIQHLLKTDYQLNFDKDIILKKIYTSEQFDKTNQIIIEIEKQILEFKKSITINLKEIELTKIDEFSEFLIQKVNEQATLKILHINMSKFLVLVETNIYAANLSLSKAGQEKSVATKERGKFEKLINDHFKAVIPLSKICNTLEKFSCNHTEKINLDEESKLCIELAPQNSVVEIILEGVKDNKDNLLFNSIAELLYKSAKLKNHIDNSPTSFQKKTNSQIANLLKEFESLTDYLEYADGSTSKSNSPGYNSEKYLQVVLNNPSCGVIIIDQPEDNLGNKFISEQLVDLIRDIKFKKQMFLITHNPAIVVYGDAESIIIAENNENSISYHQVKLEDIEAQKVICETLDGGEYIFDNRSRKYNIQRLLKEVENG